MRFLLHPPARRSTGAVVTAAQQRVARGNRSSSAVERLLQPSTPPKTTTTTTTTNPAAAKQWGQQCGPCACVLRFEAQMDATDRVTSITYTAKEVMTTRVSNNDDSNDGNTTCGGLQPLYTTRTNRPMLQECQCQSLHALASTVTSYVQNQHIQRLRPEFQSTRSSTAFRHAVLRAHDLSPQSNTHCYDVVEDAFTAMVDGYIPSRRRMDVPFQKSLRAEMLQRPLIVSSSSKSSSAKTSTKSIFPQYQRGMIIRGNGGGENNKNVNNNNNSGSSGTNRSSSSSMFGSDRNIMSMSVPPRTVSTLHMFDLNAEYWEDHQNDYDNYYNNSNSSSSSSNRSSSSTTTARQQSQDRFDWLSFVDEQYENNSEETA